MTFQPVLPLGGYAGWRFLDRTADVQRELVASAPGTQRETDAFRERIGSIRSAGELVSDRALLTVALGAFGLDDDLPNKAFIQKVLESDPSDPSALANRLADKRYLEFSRAFGFASIAGPNTRASDFADRIVAAYENRQFEVAVGEQDEALRLALTLDRELETIATRGGSSDTLWFSIMGQPPLRKVFETALGLPTSFGALDLDQQLSVFREKTERSLGSGEIAQFANPEKREELIRLFLIRSEVQQSAISIRGSTALTLLQSLPVPRSLIA